MKNNNIENIEPIQKVSHDYLIFLITCRDFVNNLKEKTSEEVETIRQQMEKEIDSSKSKHIIELLFDMAEHGK